MWGVIDATGEFPSKMDVHMTSQNDEEENDGQSTVGVQTYSHIFPSPCVCEMLFGFRSFLMSSQVRPIHSASKLGCLILPRASLEFPHHHSHDFWDLNYLNKCAAVEKQRLKSKTVRAQIVSSWEKKKKLHLISTCFVQCQDFESQLQWSFKANCVQHLTEGNFYTFNRLP